MTTIFTISYVLSCKLGGQLLALPWPFKKNCICGACTRIIVDNHHKLALLIWQNCRLL